MRRIIPTALSVSVEPFTKTIFEIVPARSRAGTRLLKPEKGLHDLEKFVEADVAVMT